MSARRVVVTGLGVVASNATGAAAYAQALQAGTSGIRTIERFDPGWGFRQAGEVTLDDDGGEGLDRVSRLARAAARQAVEDSALAGQEGWRERAGLALGTSRGPASSLEELLRQRPAPAGAALLAEIPFHSLTRNTARDLRLGGRQCTVTMACVSSSLAIGRAMDAVRGGRADVMLAGGADSLTNLSFSGFSVLRAMTRSLCRPFDRRRDGMVLGEGACVFVLEEAAHAERRGARVYAELAGWGVAGDAYHATSPHPEGRGLACAIAAALHEAEVAPGQVDHVNMHGTGTPANDPAECAALERALGRRARRVPVNSLKPMIGHTLGAAGALELCGSILAMRAGYVPPTLNTEEPDERCALDVVREKSRACDVRVLLSTKAAFGGANVAIVARQA